MEAWLFKEQMNNKQGKEINSGLYERLMSLMVQAVPLHTVMNELGHVSRGFLNRNSLQVCLSGDAVIHKHVFDTVVFKKGSRTSALLYSNNNAFLLCMILYYYRE